MSCAIRAPVAFSENTSSSCSLRISASPSIVCTMTSGANETLRIPLDDLLHETNGLDLRVVSLGISFAQRARNSVDGGGAVAPGQDVDERATLGVERWRIVHRGLLQRRGL